MLERGGGAFFEPEKDAVMTARVRGCGGFDVAREGVDREPARKREAVAVGAEDELPQPISEPDLVVAGLDRSAYRVRHGVRVQRVGAGRHLVTARRRWGGPYGRQTRF